MSASAKPYQKTLLDSITRDLINGIVPQQTFQDYRTDPLAYATEVLGVEWWSKQREIAKALTEHQKIFVQASHGVGKSHLAAGLTNWHYDCFRPGITMTTAPNAQQVKDVLWKEIRTQRRGRPGLLPKNPRMEDSADHFAVGFTAKDSTSFQGRHEANVLLVFDEAVGIAPTFWDAGESMIITPDCRWLAICNPTDTSSKAYEKQQAGDWHVITISALEHPNVVAELEGKPAPYPGAVRLSWIEERITSEDWFTPMLASDRVVTDVEFPPGSGIWYRPGPLAESRLLGRWPTQGTISVWSDGLWNACLAQKPVPNQPLAIGCDVARHGMDYTSIFVRRGGCVLHHERHNGWNTAQTAGRLKELAKQFAQDGENPRKVEIKIDDDGVGGGVTDQAAGWNFVGVSGAAKAFTPEDYPNRRSEQWFVVASMALDGGVDISRLSDTSKNTLRAQLMAPRWRVDGQGRRVVEGKDDTKKRVGCLMDDADAFNICFGTGSATWTSSSVVDYFLNRHKRDETIHRFVSQEPRKEEKVDLPSRGPVDLLVESADPDVLHGRALRFGASLVGESPNYATYKGAWRLRVTKGDPQMVRLLLEHQKYGKVIGHIPTSAVEIVS